eukprot:SAG31_NODE_6603_length_1955_cov_1.674569_2_plen_153_part_00
MLTLTKLSMVAANAAPYSSTLTENFTDVLFFFCMVVNESVGSTHCMLPLLMMREQHSPISPSYAALVHTRAAAGNQVGEALRVPTPGIEVSRLVLSIQAGTLAGVQSCADASLAGLRVADNESAIRDFWPRPLQHIGRAALLNRDNMADFQE